MHSRSIKDLPQLKIVAIEKVSQQIFIRVMPIELKQSRPVCQSHQTIHRGISY